MAGEIRAVPVTLRDVATSYHETDKEIHELNASISRMGHKLAELEQYRSGLVESLRVFSAHKDNHTIAVNLGGDRTLFFNTDLMVIPAICDMREDG